MEVEEDVDMHGEEEEVNVKTEKGLGSGEEVSIGIKEEEVIYSEMEEEEKEEEDIAIKEEAFVDIKEGGCGHKRRGEFGVYSVMFCVINAESD